MSAFVVVLMLGLLALAGLGLDGGLALAAKVRVTGEAESAARAGAQAIDLSVYRATGQLRLVPAQADALARGYLAGIGATGTVTVSGDTVTVTVTTTYRTQLLSLVGVREIGAHGAGSAHPQRGIVAEEA
ncbi:pilus assembly protein TadG-related protein [Amycolatopsis sp. H20-H5]|uniref:pilus assembly protein TadG-related protein n=1 Tax=Amycolatopsis sp. H20-H5 TaxID=3046309 RepID=UPI002DBBE6B2|nr:pilus assembly protein TadG-related protein [Amycolatopsis sp. H20-H5]MEC3978882.1 pilus assembly protein TadG-related protein [Amycolatopsis sp. H20-H5]